MKQPERRRGVATMGRDEHDRSPQRGDEGPGTFGLSSGFEALFDAAPSPFLVVTPPNYTIIAVNDAYLRATMTERAAVLGRGLFEVFPENPDHPFLEGPPELRASLHRVVAERRSDQMPVVRYDIPRPAALGGGFEERWWSPRNAPVLGPDGEVACIIHHVEDVTARVRAEAALRDIEERRAFLLKLADALRPLADASEITAAAPRILGEQLQVNRAFYAEVEGDEWVVVSGYEHGVEAQAVGRHPIAQFGAWIIDMFRAGQRLVIRDLHADARFQPSQRMAHEAYRILAAVAVPLVKQGKLVAILVVHARVPRDWTEHEIALVEETAERTWAAVERARSEVALRESEARLRRMINVERVGVLLFDQATGVLLDANDGFLHMTGYRRAQVASRVLSWRTMTPPEYLAESEAQMRAVRETGRTGPYEKEYFLADGSRAWLLFTGAALGDGTVVEYCIDMTDRRRAEAALRSSLADREALLKELHHRVKNNLQVITSLLEMQARQAGDAKALYSLSEARNRIAAIATIHELLYQSASLSEVDFAAYARRLVTHVVSFYDQQARIQTSVSGDDVTIDLARAVPLGLLLNELVSNACKHAFPSDAPGELTVGLQKDDGHLRLDVRDTGTGLPAAFDQQQAETLGLQLVSMLAKQLGGTVAYESGRGTTVEVRVPMRAQAS
jgi:PAS domain S-box-containing protein